MADKSCELRAHRRYLKSSLNEKKQRQVKNRAPGITLAIKLLPSFASREDLIGLPRTYVLNQFRQYCIDVANEEINPRSLGKAIVALYDLGAAHTVINGHPIITYEPIKHY